MGLDSTFTYPIERPLYTNRWKSVKFGLLPSDVLTNKVHPRPGILNARTCSNTRRNARGSSN